MPAIDRALPDYVEPLGGDVYAIDTGFCRPRFDAAYLIVREGRAAFVDTGTGFAVPRLLGTVQALGLRRDAVDYVIPTHVHLDHAGGAGALMRELPSATLVVHPRGARHMIDPAALWEGATAVYGAEEMRRNYGEVVPVPAARVIVTSDDQVLSLAGRPLTFAHTPGHARHHHCVWDAATRGWFSGDTFGISYREFDTDQGPWIMPTATPVQFEPDALAASVQRMLAADPACIYLTHYSRITDVPKLGARLLAMLDRFVAMARGVQRKGLAAGERHQALRQGQLDIFLASLAGHGCTMAPTRIAELLEVDLELNAQGMAIWLDRDKA